MKATSFLMQGIYLILVLVTISIVLNQVATLRYENTRQQKELELRNAANDIIEKLITDKRCMAFTEIGVTAEERQIPLTTHRMIDLEKLQNFSVAYKDTEPDCARDYQYRYTVRVEKLLQKREILKEPSEIPPAGNRDIVLVFDTSGSMCGLVTGQCTDPNKLVTAKQAAIKFLDCADKTDQLALVVFGDGQDENHLCEVTEKFPLTEIGEENSTTRQFIKGQIMSLYAYFGTPLIKSMQKAAEIISADTNSSRTKMIIFMTDGRESCCDDCATTCSCSECGVNICRPAPCFGKCSCLPTCKDKLCSVAESVIPEGIPVFTVGFDLNDQQGVNELKCVAEKTSGKFFEADLSKLEKTFCELGAKQNITEENPEFWTFGVDNHSLGSALKSSISISTAISIRVNETKSQPAVITIAIYDGELERLAGAIDNSCTTNKMVSVSASFSNPVFMKQLNGRNAICMTSKDGEFCSKLTCSRQINFPFLNAGSYSMAIIPQADKIQVEV